MSDCLHKHQFCGEATIRKYLPGVLDRKPWPPQPSGSEYRACSNCGHVEEMVMVSESARANYAKRAYGRKRSADKEVVPAWDEWRF
jgi:hypothetical protein